MAAWRIASREIPPQPPAARRGLDRGPDLAEAHATIGSFYRGQNSPRTAQKHLECAVQLKPSHAEGLKSLGGLHLAQGRLAKALELLRLAVEVNPEHSDAWFQLYGTLLATGPYKEALRESRQLRDIRRAFPPASR